MGKNKSSVKKVGTVAEKISIVTEEIVKNKDNISNLTNDHFKLVIGTVGAIGEAAMPYLPLISSVLTLTAKIVKAYDNAQYNKKSCAALIQRVQSAEVAVKVLDRRKQENKENFHQQTYYINFERFITILGDIEAFMTDFTRLSQYKKFISNNVIKERFIGLINDFDRVVHDLGFTMIIASDEDRKKEIEILNKDISEMSKFLQTIEAGVTTIDKKISHVLEHVLILQDKKKDKDFSPPIKKIPPNEIKIENFTLDLPETEFGKIVNSAWQHDPTLRPELNYLFNDLEKICTKFANVSGISSSMLMVLELLTSTGRKWILVDISMFKLYAYVSNSIGLKLR
nr:4841_t:CDS:2 [Entrophospora candida]